MSAMPFFPQPKPEAPCVTRERQRRAKQAHDSRERTKVRARDGAVCRCCRKRWAREVHELLYRSRGGAVKTSNAVALCRQCHQLIHAKLITVLGNDANGEVHFARR